MYITVMSRARAFDVAPVSGSAKPKSRVIGKIGFALSAGNGISPGVGSTPGSAADGAPRPPLRSLDGLGKCGRPALPRGRCIGLSNALSSGQ